MHFYWGGEQIATSSIYLTPLFLLAALLKAKTISNHSLFIIIFLKLESVLINLFNILCFNSNSEIKLSIKIVIEHIVHCIVTSI